MPSDDLEKILLNLQSTDSDHQTTVTDCSDTVRQRITTLRRLLTTNPPPQQPGAWIRVHPQHHEWTQLTADITIGRGTGCTITCDSPYLSTEHCSIRLIDDIWTIEDLSSHNGTRLHGTQITTHPLCSGDIIALGDTIIIFIQVTK